MNAKSWMTCAVVWLLSIGSAALPAISAEDRPGAADWSRTCKKVANREVCLSHARAVEANGLAASVGIMKANSGGGDLLRVLVPLGAQINFGTRVLIDNDTPLNGAYDRCSKDGCTASYRLNAETVSRLQGAGKLTVQAINIDGKPLNFIFALANLGKANEAAAAAWASVPASRRDQLQSLVQGQDGESKPTVKGGQVAVGYVPWTHFCTRDDKGALRACFTRMVAWNAAGTVATSIALIEPANEPKKILRVDLPSGTALGTPVQVTIDKFSPETAAFAICNPNRCFADVAFREELRERLSNGKSLTIKFQEQSGLKVALPMPLAGFRAALASSPIESKQDDLAIQKVRKEIVAGLGNGRWKGERGTAVTEMPGATASAAPAAQPASGAAAVPSDDPATILKRYQAALKANDHQTALREAETYEAAVKNKFGVAHELYGFALYNLGVAHHNLRALDVAEGFLNRSLTIRSAKNNDIDIAWTLFNLSKVYFDQGKYEKAEPLLNRVISLREKAHGQEHPNIGPALYLAGMTSQRQKKYAEAEAFHKRALAIREKDLTDGETGRAWSLKSVGSVLEDQKKYAEAVGYYKKGLPIAERLFAPADLADYQYELALVYRPLGEYAEAERLIRRVIPVYEQQSAKSSKLELALIELAFIVRSQGRLDEALDLVKRSYAIQEARLGEDDPKVAESLARLGNFYKLDLKYAEAEPIFLRVLGLQEKKFGSNNVELVPHIERLASYYRASGHLDAAEAQYQRIVAINEAQRKPTDTEFVHGLFELATTYRMRNKVADAQNLEARLLAIQKQAIDATDRDAKVLEQVADEFDLQARYVEAEALYRAAIAVLDAARKVDDAPYATVLRSLGSVLRSQSKLREAEDYYKRSLQIREKVLGPRDPLVGSVLSSLGLLQYDFGKYADAEAYYKRTLSIYESDSNIPSNRMAFDYRIIGPLNNLALVYRRQGRYSEAESLNQKALGIQRQMIGTGTTDVARTLNYLAILNRLQGNLDKAEEFHRQAVAIAERSSETSPLFVVILNSLAYTHQLQGKYTEAERIYRRAMGVVEKRTGDAGIEMAELQNDLAEAYLLQGRNEEARSLLLLALAQREQKLGTDHPKVAETLNNLAKVSDAMGLPTEALSYSRRASSAIAGPVKAMDSAGGRDDSASTLTATQAGYFAQHVHSLAVAIRGEVAPDAAMNSEAFNFAQRASHSVAASALQQMNVRSASKNATIAAIVREKQDLDAQWYSLDLKLNEAMSRRETIEDRAAAAALRKQIGELDARRREVIVRLDREFPDYAALSAPKPLRPEEAKTLLGPDEALVYFLVGDKQSYVFTLTQDQLKWQELPAGAAEFSEKVKRFRRGLHDFEDQRLELVKTRKRPELFDLSVAHELYATLLGPVEEIVKTKRHVIVVPSGPLTALPFHLLVTDRPAIARPEIKDIGTYRNAAWLIKRQAVTVLPSVASLRSVRTIGGAQQAPKSLIGFGDPVFDPAERARAVAEQRAAIKVAAKTRAYTEFWRGAGVDRVNLAQSLPSLLDTATELKTIAKQLGAPASDILLENNATEANVKSRALADYRIVYFATHGLVAGDVSGMGEPSLALTLPQQPNSVDDGLLTASEVAQLSLNADWVVLSACNTMAGDKPGADALSGLARAFFYAGARALLVSHWSVDSAAATRLTTSTFGKIAAEFGLGRSEALRRAMIDYMNDTTNPLNAYPAFWGPFSVVGEGAR